MVRQFDGYCRLRDKNDDSSAYPQYNDGVDTAKIFMDEVVRLHGLPRVIVSDRDAKFTSNFWKEVCRVMGTALAMSSGFHP